MAQTPKTVTIDITPTWSGILPALIAIVENGETVEAHKTAEAELLKMAGLADRFVREVRAAAWSVAVETEGYSADIVDTFIVMAPTEAEAKQVAEAYAKEQRPMGYIKYSEAYRLDAENARVVGRLINTNEE